MESWLITLIYILVFVVIIALAIYIYLELAKKSLKNLKDRSTKVTIVESKKHTIYILGDKKDDE